MSYLGRGIAVTRLYIVVHGLSSLWISEQMYGRWDGRQQRNTTSAQATSFLLLKKQSTPSPWNFTRKEQWGTKNFSAGFIYLGSQPALSQWFRVNNNILYLFYLITFSVPLSFPIKKKSEYISYYFQTICEIRLWEVSSEREFQSYASLHDA